MKISSASRLGASLALLILSLWIVIFGLPMRAPINVSACTWVTTSCGSGCADNKDLYNCSNKVQIQSVTPSVSNPDSNAKAAVVAPPTVTQYVPPVTQTPTPQAYQYLTTTPGQTVGADVTTTDVTGQGGNVTSATGQTVTGTRTGTTTSGGISTSWDGTCTDLTKTFCGGAGNLYSCHPIMIGSICDMRCSTGVSHDCAVAMGRPELKEGVTGPGLIIFTGDGVGSCGDAPCDGISEMQIVCKAGGHICVDRATIVRYQLGGAKDTNEIQAAIKNLGPNGTMTTAVTTIKLDQLLTGLSSSACTANGCTYSGTGTNLFIFNSATNSYYVNSTAGEVFGTGQTAGSTVPYVAGGANTCSPGTYQSMMMGTSVVKTQMGGDRGACGAAGGCSAGMQRLCDADGHLSSNCVRSDACAAQLQSVSEGGSCGGLKQISSGEASKGMFVGCSGGKNCFCSNFTSATVTCYPDAGNDSCGAAGYNQPIVTVTTPPSTPPTAAPTPTPTPVPQAVCGQPCGNSANGTVCTGTDIACVDVSGNSSGTYKCVSTTCSPADQDSQCKCIEKPVAPICLGLYASTNQIGIGTNVTFTCQPVANAARYEFRYGYSTQKFGTTGMVVNSIASQTTTSNVSQPLTVSKIGRYVVQCRPCAVNDLCTEWESLSGGGLQLVSQMPTPTPVAAAVTPTPAATVAASATPAPVGCGQPCGNSPGASGATCGNNLTCQAVPQTGGNSGLSGAAVMSYKCYSAACTPANQDNQCQCLTAATATPSPTPTATPATNVVPAVTNRSTAPANAVLTSGGTGITNGAAMNDGNFQVEAYCTQKQLGTVAQDANNWSCGSTVLTASNFDEICALTYPSVSPIFAIHNGTSTTAAFNWRCYTFSGGAQ
jgi:hypothetical protein